MLALAAGLLRASDTADLVYRFHLGSHFAKVEWSAAATGNWDVEVAVDPANCQVTCSYKLKHNSPAARLLAPPVVVVRVYSDFVSLPEQFTADPAGLEFPSAAAKLQTSQGFFYLPGRKLRRVRPLVARLHLETARQADPPEFAGGTSNLSTLAIPLRV